MQQPTTHTDMPTSTRRIQGHVRRRRVPSRASRRALTDYGDGDDNVEPPIIDIEEPAVVRHRVVADRLASDRANHARKTEVGRSNMREHVTLLADDEPMCMNPLQTSLLNADLPGFDKNTAVSYAPPTTHEKSPNVCSRTATLHVRSSPSRCTRAPSPSRIRQDTGTEIVPKSDEDSDTDTPGITFKDMLDTEDVDEGLDEHQNVEVSPDAQNQGVDPNVRVESDVNPCVQVPSNISVLAKRVKAVLKWERIVAYLAICGSAPFSKKQYQFLMDLISGMEGCCGLHDYKTVRRQLAQNLMQWCFPKSSVYFIEEVEQPRGTADHKIVDTVNAEKKPAQACARIVLPSEWAKLDVATYTFYSDVFDHPQHTSHDHLSIEQAPIVRSRATFVGESVELWSLFEGTPCPTSPGDTINVPCAARPLHTGSSELICAEWFDHEMDGTNTQRAVIVRAVMCGTWMIGKVEQESERSNRTTVRLPRGCEHWTEHELALHYEFSTPCSHEHAFEPGTYYDGDADPSLPSSRNRQAPLSKNKERESRQLNKTNVIELYPGDQCVLLRSEKRHDELRECTGECTEPVRTQHCLLIGSPVRQSLGLSTERLVWLEVNKCSSIRATVRFIGSSNVIDMPTWKHGADGMPHVWYNFGPPQNRGYLRDGSPYVVYRFALYMDGFKEKRSQRDTRSVGGCYILPLGLSLENRRGTESARVITICPNGVSHNNVLKDVMKDIRRAAVTGVSGFDPYGRRVRIFLDPVTFFGDYPAAALCSDAVGHTANAFCTHCSNVKRSAPGGSTILSTPMNHSRRIGFHKTDARLDAMRSANLRSDLYRLVGMKSKDVLSSRSLPLVSLSVELREAAGPERAENGDEVSPLIFQSSLSCATVPDHLFNGLIKNMFNVLFDAVQPDRRLALETRIGSTARENGLNITGRILRWGTRGEFKGLNNHTMTDLMTFLLCAAPVFDDEHKITGGKVFTLCRSLQRFAAAVYFWPVPRVDGERHNHMFKVEGRIKYYADLHEMAKAYLRDCDEIMRHDQVAGAVLDKPNAHRAIELVLHTIPTFGHAKNCSEMVLEHMHQVFKGWLERNTHQDSHLTAVERALMMDWMGRVYALYKVWEKGETSERACSELGLRRLVMGEEACVLDDRQDDVRDLKKDFSRALLSAMRAPNENFLGKCAHLSLSHAREVAWDVINGGKVKTDAAEAMCPVVRAGVLKLGRVYKIHDGKESTGVVLYKTARLHSSNKLEGRHRTYKYNEVTRGCVVSAVCATEDVVVHDDADVCSTLRFFAVFGITKVTVDGKLWAITRRMRRTSDDEQALYISRPEEVSLVELGRGVRRAGAAHKCDARCKYTRRTMDVEHSASVLEGGVYELWSRQDGYPPHRG